LGVPASLRREDSPTEASIRLLVHTLYDGVRRDEILGPVFDQAVHGDWDGHVQRMTDFWSTVLLGAGRFQGNVCGEHMALAGMESGHVVRWLALFKQTVMLLFVDAAAEEILLSADRISGSLQPGFCGEQHVALP